MRIRAAAGLVALQALLASLAGCAGDPGASGAESLDPLWTDPVVIDADHPPAMAALRIESGGAAMNAVLYIAGGAGPHPTIVLLHGFPGNEKNLDLAQAVRRTGFNVLFFHYRGSWGSGGDFAFGHVVEDVTAVLAFLRADPVRERYRVDADRLALVGHSLGGFAALQAASRDPGVDCVAAIAPWDLGVMAASLDGGANSPVTRANFAAVVDGMAPLSGMSGVAAVDEILTRRDAFDLVHLAPDLRGKSVLLIGAARDRVLPPELHFQPLVVAYEAVPDINLDAVLLDGDHAFSWTRSALIRAVTRWLDQSCRVTAKPPA